MRRKAVGEYGSPRSPSEQRMLAHQQLAALKQSAQTQLVAREANNGPRIGSQRHGGEGGSATVGGQRMSGAGEWGVRVGGAGCQGGGIAQGGRGGNPQHLVSRCSLQGPGKGGCGGQQPQSPSSPCSQHQNVSVSVKTKGPRPSTSSSN